MKCTYVLGISLCLVACAESSNSNLDYVHSKAENATISPLGGIQILRSSLDFKFDSYDVCVRKGSKTISDSSLLKETKLAYAAWIHAAGYGEEEWELFNFQLKSECKDNQDHLASVVILDVDKDTNDSQYDRYSSFSINCERSGYSYSCGGSSATLGLGRWGNIGYSYDGRSGKWTDLYSFSQVRASFSQYVDWHSLKEDFKRNKELSSSDRNELLSAYDRLSGNSQFMEFVEFSDLLAEKDMKSIDDEKFSKLFKDFQKSGKNSLNKDFRSEQALYHVLLHEVGHNFGMRHSHQQAPDGSIAVETEGLRIKKDGREEFVSTMAYSDDYLYLTKDDKLGIQSMRRETENYLKKRLP